MVYSYLLFFFFFLYQNRVIFQTDFLFAHSTSNGFLETLEKITKDVYLKINFSTRFFFFF
jgi:hypothetical protein